MELIANIDYKLILNLIHQFPKKDFDRLIKKLKEEIKQNKSKESLQELLLKVQLGLSNI